jgi:hypothetical protein
MSHHELTLLYVADNCNCMVKQVGYFLLTVERMKI